MTPERQAWRSGYARQALSDYRTYKILVAAREADECQRLHYLQMCLEKLAKSCYYAGKGSLPSSIQTNHKFIAKVIPQVFLDFVAKRGAKERGRISGSEMKLFRNVCRELDYLAPAVDDHGRRDNCEYPWDIRNADGAFVSISTPCGHHFPVYDQLNTPIVLRFLKVLFYIICSYEEQ